MSEHELWEQIKDKWGPEYHEQWPELLQMVNGSPYKLLESRESIIAVWPGLLSQYGVSHPQHKIPLIKRIKRAWHALVGTS